MCVCAIPPTYLPVHVCVCVPFPQPTCLCMCVCAIPPTNLPVYVCVPGRQSTLPALLLRIQHWALLAGTKAGRTGSGGCRGDRLRMLRKKGAVNLLGMSTVGSFAGILARRNWKWGVSRRPPKHAQKQGRTDFARNEHGGFLCRNPGKKELEVGGVGAAARACSETRLWVCWNC